MYPFPPHFTCDRHHMSRNMSTSHPSLRCTAYSSKFSLKLASWKLRECGLLEVVVTPEVTDALTHSCRSHHSHFTDDIYIYLILQLHVALFYAQHMSRCFMIYLPLTSISFSFFHICRATQTYLLAGTMTNRLWKQHPSSSTPTNIELLWLLMRS